MKKHSLLAIAIATTPLMVQAEITKATLYPSHAELTWEEREQVSSGTGTVEIEGLPLSLQDQKPASITGRYLRITDTTGSDHPGRTGGICG